MVSCETQEKQDMITFFANVTNVISQAVPYVQDLSEFALSARPQKRKNETPSNNVNSRARQAEELVESKQQSRETIM